MITLSKYADIVDINELATYLTKRVADYKEELKARQSLPNQEANVNYINGLISAYESVLLSIGYEEEEN